MRDLHRLAQGDAFFLQPGQESEQEESAALIKSAAD